VVSDLCDDGSGVVALRLSDDSDRITLSEHGRMVVHIQYKYFQLGGAGQRW